MNDFNISLNEPINLAKAHVINRVSSAPISSIVTNWGIEEVVVIFRNAEGGRIVHSDQPDGITTCARVECVFSQNEGAHLKRVGDRWRLVGAENHLARDLMHYNAHEVADLTKHFLKDRGISVDFDDLCKHASALIDLFLYHYQNAVKEAEKIRAQMEAEKPNCKHDWRDCPGTADLSVCSKSGIMYKSTDGGASDKLGARRWTTDGVTYQSDADPMHATDGTPVLSAAPIVRLFDKLCGALERRGTEQDGGWGSPSFLEELATIRTELAKHKEGGE